MTNLVKVKLHGDISKHLQNEWELSIRSVREAINAINSLTNNAFNRYFIDNNKLRAKYRILINGRDFTTTESEINEENAHMVTESEIYMKRGNLETIDIVPVLEAADSKGGGIFATILGIILIVVGFAFPALSFLIAPGLGLLAAGVTALLTRPPKSSFSPAPDGKQQSYLFSGPVNTIGEGGPVPVGYGLSLVGSQVISSAYKTTDYSIT